jgi:alginate O-acetyltransferase complex protein AlgI
MATSIADFWRRWHISLSTFFKDYIYIPLGGNRSYQIRNILIVWGLTGLWHGASWNFVLWGCYFGLLLIIEKLLLGKILEAIPTLFRHIYALFFILLGWGIFYFTNMNQMLEFFSILFKQGENPLIDLEVQTAIKENSYWLVLALILCSPVYHVFQNTLTIFIKNKLTIDLINYSLPILLFFISVIMLVSSTYNQFIYFRF